MNILGGIMKAYGGKWKKVKIDWVLLRVMHVMSPSCRVDTKSIQFT